MINSRHVLVTTCLLASGALAQDNQGFIGNVSLPGMLTGVLYWKGKTLPLTGSKQMIQIH
jgi:hypothetical protein